MNVKSLYDKANDFIMIYVNRFATWTFFSVCANDSAWMNVIVSGRARACMCGGKSILKLNKKSEINK